MKKVHNNLTEREVLEKKLESARMDLLLVVILTVVNIVMYFTGSETMMLFSASVPFYSVIFADIFGITAIGVALAVVVVVLYVLCWLLSKKNSKWLIVALVLFVLDTLCMAGMYFLLEDGSGIADALIHILVLYYLFSGIQAGKKLKELPEEVHTAEVVLPEE